MCVANEIAAPHHLQYIPPIRQLQGFQNHYVRRKPVERKMMRKVSERSASEERSGEGVDCHLTPTGSLVLGRN